MKKQKLIGKTGVYTILIDDVVRYIGSSGSSLESRKSNHLGLLRHGRHSNKELQELFDLHGEEKFRFYVIDYCDVESLYELEKLHIKIHKDTIFNKDRVAKLDRHIRTEEESRKLSERMSELMSGEGNPNCKLIENQVKEILNLKEEGLHYKDVANLFNVSESHINKIGKTRWLSVV